MAGAGRAVKETLVKELSERLGAGQPFVVTAVNRLSAPEADALRQKLHASQAEMLMMKRSLSRLAFAALKLPDLETLLGGSVAVVFPGEDALPAVKVVVDFAKTHEDMLAVRGGFLEGQVLSTQSLVQLANLPPRPVLLAQVVGTLEAPMADVIMTIEQLIGDLAWITEQAAAAKPAAPAAQAGSSAPAAGEAPAPTPGPDTTPKAAETPPAPPSEGPSAPTQEGTT